jgi:hypothetical protein
MRVHGSYTDADLELVVLLVYVCVSISNVQEKRDKYEYSKENGEALM